MRDITTKELVNKMEAMLEANPRTQLYVKWTCPGCGERVTDSQPNRFCEGGYTHEEKDDGSYCGYHYRGEYWGLLALFNMERK